MSLQVLERGWLSANNIVFQDGGFNTVVDTGYHTHAPQTLALIDAALAGAPLHRIINTHLHSDHCGGNAALVAHYGSQVWIPPGEAAAVAAWDELALSYAATGQHCPRFAATALVQPGQALRLGGHDWTAHAAPGHDPASLILHCEATRTLISADALWENGFGVIFPELTGEPGFAQVAATLDLIESLNASTIIPGHGAPFGDAPAALARARSRLDGFMRDPQRHLWHGVKVLIVFHLMDVQSASRSAVLAHLGQAKYLQAIAPQLGFAADDQGAAALVAQAMDELLAKGAVLATDSVAGIHYRAA